MRKPPIQFRGMATYMGFFTAVEFIFQEKRGKFVLLDPTDWPVIEKWFEQGIPLDCIQAGIDLSFANARGKPVYSLQACNGAVMNVWKKKSPHP